jgi:hypothetical protein
MTLPACLYEKLFYVQINDAAIEALLEAVDTGLVGTLLNCYELDPSISGQGEAWQIVQTVIPYTLTVYGADLEEPASGYLFRAATRYQQIQEIQDKEPMRFSAQGSIHMECFVGIRANDRETVLYLRFFEPGGAPMWLCPTAEMLVANTVQAIADSVRATAFRSDYGGPVLLLIQGGWRPRNASWGPLYGKG